MNDASAGSAEGLEGGGAIDAGTAGVVPIDTNILRTDGPYTFDKARWADWNVPVVQ